MPAFSYHNGMLCCDAVPLATLAAEFGTPLYVYSANRLRENYRRLAAVFAPRQPAICYSVKANSNLSILRLLKAEGAGFDIVSGGELFRVLQVGADPSRIVFAGAGKTQTEIKAALQVRVGWINVESAGELHCVNTLAQPLGVWPNIAIRLRPEVDADTHPSIRTGSARSKFGLPSPLALELVQARPPQVQIRGVHVHIGSQLGSPDATLQAIDVVLAFVARARAAGAEIEMINLGGGFPIAYRDDEVTPDLAAFAAPILARLEAWPGRIQIEPGRAVVADAGALLTTVQYDKRDASGYRIVVVDAGMQTLIRPALYAAYHRVRPVRQVFSAGDPQPHLTLADVAGPICESADFLARDRMLPPLSGGELLAILDAGAYGFSMASNYNAHPLPAEVLVEGDTYRLIRRRQTDADLIANERLQA